MRDSVYLVSMRFSSTGYISILAEILAPVHHGETRVANGTTFTVEAAGFIIFRRINHRGLYWLRVCCQVCIKEQINQKPGVNMCNIQFSADPVRRSFRITFRRRLQEEQLLQSTIDRNRAGYKVMLSVGGKRCPLKIVDSHQS